MSPENLNYFLNILFLILNPVKLRNDEADENNFEKEWNFYREKKKDLLRRRRNTTHSNDTGSRDFQVFRRRL